MVLVRIPNTKMWVGKYEVTQEEYQQVVGSNPSKSKNGRQPVESVSWNDATNFISKLNDLEGAHRPVGMVYALPTEAQWNEFRGDQKFEDLPPGATGKTSPSPVGQTGPANKFGLYDVLGNVGEWCLDDATSGQKRLKGGAYNSRSESRSLPPETTAGNYGFRCVLVAQ
jgi:formylglycine-generating enzyme required for sulfatase activity